MMIESRNSIKSDSVKRFMIHSTVRRISILDELSEQAGIDRSDLLNKLMFNWIIEQVDQDLQQPIKDVFGYS